LTAAPPDTWHMNCDICDWTDNMATKIKLMKMVQQFQGYAQITNRRPAPRPPVLYIMQLREQSAQATVPKRRLAVQIEAKDVANTPLAIKINHIQPGESFLPMVVG
jgi:hypothetical protein